MQIIDCVPYWSAKTRGAGVDSAYWGVLEAEAERQRQQAEQAMGDVERNAAVKDDKGSVKSGREELRCGHT